MKKLTLRCSDGIRLANYQDPYDNDSWVVRYVPSGTIVTGWLADDEQSIDIQYDGYDFVLEIDRQGWKMFEWLEESE